MQILRSVDAYGFHRGHSHLDGKAIFKPSELLKTFSHLKSRLWNGGDALEHISLIGIHAEVGVELMTRSAIPPFRDCAHTESPSERNT